jgi:hypothetical protein
VKVYCPKCRALGLPFDCTDRLTHGYQEQDMSIGPDDDYELEVTLRFCVPVSSTLPIDPHEMAGRLRETWISEETQLQDALLECVNGDFDLQVRPVFVL